MAKTRGARRRPALVPDDPWLLVQVTLRTGRGEAFDPPPERVIVASVHHTFAELAMAIDLAFGRRQLDCLRQFTCEDGTRVGDVVADLWGETPREHRRTRLERLGPGERFDYLFDFSDCWVHECLVVDRVDPMEVLGTRPGRPVIHHAVGASPPQLRTSAPAPWVSPPFESRGRWPVPRSS
ncbi:MAG: IS1096 element passenger TnpR family protein [Acidimicrobiales bacterium]